MKRKLNNKQITKNKIDQKLFAFLKYSTNWLLGSLSNFINILQSSTTKAKVHSDTITN